MQRVLLGCAPLVYALGERSDGRNRQALIFLVFRPARERGSATDGEGVNHRSHSSFGCRLTFYTRACTRLHMYSVSTNNTLQASRLDATAAHTPYLCISKTKEEVCYLIKR